MCLPAFSHHHRGSQQHVPCPSSMLGHDVKLISHDAKLISRCVWWMRYAGCAAGAATLTRKSREISRSLRLSARPWHGTTRAPGRSADRMVGGFARAKLLEPCASESSTVVRMTMLWTLFVVLLLLWVLGVVSSYTLGGFIHLLLILAVVAVLVQLITGRRAV